MKHWHKTPVPSVLKTLGDWLKIKRLERRLTQKQVSAIVGVSHNAISFYEANCYEPTDRARQRVLEFIGFDPYAEMSPETTIQQQPPLA